MEDKASFLDNAKHTKALQGWNANMISEQWPLLHTKYQTVYGRLVWFLGIAYCVRSKYDLLVILNSRYENYSGLLTRFTELKSWISRKNEWELTTLTVNQIRINQFALPTAGKINHGTRCATLIFLKPAAFLLTCHSHLMVRLHIPHSSETTPAGVDSMGAWCKDGLIPAKAVARDSRRVPKGTGFCSLLDLGSSVVA